MPWQASSRRTVKSTMASRVASPAQASNATVVSSITWRQFGREGHIVTSSLVSCDINDFVHVARPWSSAETPTSP
eukprot:scaffold64790_cov33-Phaeocystis_antarctica.AAC.1